MSRPLSRPLSILIAVLFVAVPPGTAGAQAAMYLAGAPASAPAAPRVAELGRDLLDILHAPGFRNAHFGVLVVSLSRGDTLFALNPDLALEPASNLKLYTTAAALSYLGPDFRFSTYLLADGRIADGVLNGDLVLYGTGDPSLSGRMIESPRTVFDAMVDTLVAHGITQVNGDVVGDGSYFDSDWTGTGWTDSDLEAWYGVPVGALSINENMVTIRVSPGRAGGPARVSTTPDARGIAIENRVTTTSHGTTRIRVERGTDGLLLEGSIRRGRSPWVRTLPVVDPANYAAAVLCAALENRGIRVTGGVRTVRLPARSAVTFATGPAFDDAAPQVLAVHLSPPLDDVVTITNHLSLNSFADAMLKTVGRVVLGEGSFDAGADAVREFLRTGTMVDPGIVTQLDGSGLSRFDRTTARTTVALLDHMSHADVSEVYFNSLPQAGNRRGLDRMFNTAAAGNLRAKTGTLHDVSALSGYVTAANGERLIFSIMANGISSTAREKRSENQIGAQLARFWRPLDVGGPAAVVVDDQAATPRAE